MFTSLGDEVCLSDLPKLANFERICVKVKVVAVKECKKVSKGLVKQDCIVADATGSGMIILWEENVDTLGKGISYKSSGIIVRTYLNWGRSIFPFQKNIFEVKMLKKKKWRRRRG